MALYLNFNFLALSTNANFDIKGKCSVLYQILSIVHHIEEKAKTDLSLRRLYDPGPFYFLCLPFQFTSHKISEINFSYLNISCESCCLMAEWPRQHLYKTKL